MSAARPVEAAHRSRERRQRSWWRHEQLSVAGSVATAFHHSAQRLSTRQPCGSGSLHLRSVMSPTALSCRFWLITTLPCVYEDTRARVLFHFRQMWNRSWWKVVLRGARSCYRAGSLSGKLRQGADVNPSTRQHHHCQRRSCTRFSSDRGGNRGVLHFISQERVFVRNVGSSPAATRLSSLMRVCSTKWNSPCTCSCLVEETVNLFSSFAVSRTWNCWHYFFELVVASGGISHISSLASHAVHSLPCPSPALACSGLTASPPCSAARSSAAVAASAACAAVLPAHDTGAGCWVCGGQGPRSRRGTKAVVSGTSENKTSDLQETEAYLRTVRRVTKRVGTKIVVSRPPENKTPHWAGGCGFQSGAAHQVPVQDKEGSPSVHMGVLDSLSVTPGHGVGIWQQLGWRKVRGTALWGVWVLKVSPRKKAAHRSQSLNCELYTGGHEEHGLGDTEAPFRHFRPHHGNWHLEFYPVALWQRAPVWEAGGTEDDCKYEPLIPWEIAEGENLPLQFS